MNSTLIPSERIEKAIYLIRGEKVMVDRDLALLYEVETKMLNRAVALRGHPTVGIHDPVRSQRTAGANGGETTECRRILARLQRAESLETMSGGLRTTGYYLTRLRREGSPAYANQTPQPGSGLRFCDSRWRLRDHSKIQRWRMTENRKSQA